MISDSTFEAIGLLAQEINSRGVILKVVEDSALDIVKSSGYVPNVNFEQINEEDFIDEYKKVLDRPLMSGAIPELVTMGNGMVPVREHEETLQFVNNVNIGLMDGILDRARNKIQPFIVNVCRAATDIPNRANQLELLFDIRNIEHFSGWRSDWVARILEQFQVNELDWDSAKMIVVPSAPDTLPKTGNVSFDELLESFLVEFGSSVADIFTLFNDTIPHPESPESSEYFDRLMFTFLLLCSCEDDPWEGTGLSLDEYRSTVSEAQYQLAKWLKCYMDQIATDAESDLLIRGVRAIDAVTVVYTNPIAYARFLEQGGKVEMIYGMLLLATSGDHSKYFVHSNMILEWQNTYLELWDEKITVDRTKHSQEWLEGVRSALFRGFNQELLAADSDVLPPGVTIEEALANFKDFIYSEVQLFNVNEIDLLIMDGLKRYVFCGEMTIDLLRLIDMYLKEGMDDADAQRQATLDIIFEWVCSQLYVAK